MILDDTFALCLDHQWIRFCDNLSIYSCFGNFLHCRFYRFLSLGNYSKLFIADSFCDQLSDLIYVLTDFIIGLRITEKLSVMIVVAFVLFSIYRFVLFCTLRSVNVADTSFLLDSSLLAYFLPFSETYNASVPSFTIIAIQVTFDNKIIILCI